ncbi:2-C-methyl-D-erythritol 4-phosphate cytidylyltransferase [Parasponia andersonii]|uniref:2-C-methyl-D-erythritol 4-phosphate cytidylyltransferase n=1 Tax=Parasponia andersonii TaxID=3476 RepID=A0A2P5AL76_PARAD|nr:2-C-methyl-D-erythritol 4-phosphate cytidylyltransferase [Parasponia andersonii]
MMKSGVGLVLVLLVLTGLAPSGYGWSSTVPAFLWSPHYHHPLPSSSSPQAPSVNVNYQTISSKDLTKSLLTPSQPGGLGLGLGLGWSHLLCSLSDDKDKQQPLDLDLALVFVGTQLRSSDIYAKKNAHKDFVDLLKVSFAGSNLSMAFPYVTASEEETIADSLLAGFTEACGDNFRFNNIAFSESCSVAGGNFKKLANLQSVHDYLGEKRATGEAADVVVFCHEGSNSVDEPHQSHPESETFVELVNSMDRYAKNYAVLYVSDPFKSIQYPSNREVERFLGEGTNSIGCGEVCKIKSSLLEGLLVAIVLLIILISGICCMMGIDTPTRFETPQES